MKPGQKVLAALAVYTGVTAAAYTALARREAAKAEKEVPVEFLIILGAWVEGETPCEALVLRIDRAAAYLKAHPETKAIATGGCFRKGQTKSEAAVIRDGLVAAGIGPERILPEDQSRVTYENFDNCEKILRALGRQEASVGILTNGFHILRAKGIAKQRGFDRAVMLAADSPARPWKLYAREYLVSYELLLRGLFGRDTP